MLDFSKVPQGGDGSSAEALAGIPDGTLMVCELQLTDKSFSDLTPMYLSRNKFHEHGLVMFHYDLVVKMPDEQAGRTIPGQKPVTASTQREYGVDYPGMVQETLKGDRAVAAILAFDGACRGVAPSMEMKTYDDLEGRLCAAMVTTWQGKKCLQILSPLRQKERMTCEMLADKWRTKLATPPAPPPAQHPVQQMPPVTYQPWPPQPPVQVQQQVQRTIQQRQAYQQQTMPQAVQQALPQGIPQGWQQVQPQDDDVPF